MNFLGDYHTHTIFSRKPFLPFLHAKGTLEDNIKTASKLGLKQVAITDHGFNHKYFACSRKNLKSTKQEILRLGQKYNIQVFLGVEANFLSQDGTIDVDKEDMKYLDIVLCGYHKLAKPKTLKDKFNIFLPNIFANHFGTSKKLLQRNTNMIINALEKNNIDIITHPNNKMRCDLGLITKKAVEKGTLIELNERHCCFTESEIKMMLELGAKFIVNSDAHKPEKIGKFKNMESIIKRYNIPEDRVVNLNSLPEFLNQKKSIINN